MAQTNSRSGAARVASPSRFVHHTPSILIQRRIGRSLNLENTKLFRTLLHHSQFSLRSPRYLAVNALSSLSVVDSQERALPRLLAASSGIIVSLASRKHSESFSGGVAPPAPLSPIIR
ncbi:hypothetical protein Cni_G10282 [Canna indica]|uniref:Uncharacterized protein n=1 Tax=Canna indica TaxID=4628 RepID=A0AAQ3K5V2_9LILI|nr:hypothetical protein Cni_G10282 [Canna indica]